MPCRSDYLEPTPGEYKRQEVASLFSYALRATNTFNPKSKQHQQVNSCSDDIYCAYDWTVDLCALINSLNDKERKELLNLDDIEAARLKAWWLEHQAQDESNKRLEAQRKKDKEIRDRALDKLTPEEREVLGLGGNNGE